MISENLNNWIVFRKDSSYVSYDRNVEGVGEIATYRGFRSAILTTQDRVATEVIMLPKTNLQFSFSKIAEFSAMMRVNNLIPFFWFGFFSNEMPYSKSLLNPDYASQVYISGGNGNSDFVLTAIKRNADSEPLDSSNFFNINTGIHIDIDKYYNLKLVLDGSLNPPEIRYYINGNNVLKMNSENYVDYSKNYMFYCGIGTYTDVYNTFPKSSLYIGNLEIKQKKTGLELPASRRIIPPGTPPKPIFHKPQKKP